jgi:acetyltransferase-like isoleucine patch superfamily enzyme
MPTSSGAEEDLLRHPSALVETSSIGERTRIAAFVHILAGARIGKQCVILDHAFVDRHVNLGDRVTIGAGARLCGWLELRDDVVVGPNTVFAADGMLRTKVGPAVSIGAAAAILPGVEIGEGAVISAGTVISGNVPSRAIVSGNPARITGYVQPVIEPPPAGPETPVRGVVLQALPRFEDMRGALTVAEVQKHIPFPVARLFLVYDVSTREVRGEHAHRRLEQFLICIRGSCAVVADDGENRQEYLLDSPNCGLYLPPLIWSVQHKHSPDAMLLVVASAPYDPGDYIRDYELFRQTVQGRAK